jgi:phosphoglycolate phosphatase
MHSYTYIIFDLDGTLSDPGEGIVNSLKHALKHFGLEGDPKILRKFIGPPLAESFKEFFNFDPEQTAEAIRLYRQYFHEFGLFQNVIYPGIPELLEDLTKAGNTLAIATTKPEVYAVQILEYFKIDHLFRKELVVGSFLDGRRTNKGELIATVLQRLGCSPQDAVMIGDRKYDIIGAKANHIDVIGITYGYGDVDEIEAFTPTAIAHSVEELRQLLLPPHELTE